MFLYTTEAAQPVSSSSTFFYSREWKLSLTLYKNKVQEGWRVLVGRVLWLSSFLSQLNAEVLEVWGIISNSYPSKQPPIRRHPFILVDMFLRCPTMKVFKTQTNVSYAGCFSNFKAHRDCLVLFSRDSDL